MKPTSMLGQFSDLGYYPGSNRPRVRHANRRTPKGAKAEAKTPSEDGWDAKPRIYSIRGVDTEFFTIGQLARALEREPVTLRKWEQAAVIPKATYSAPSEDTRGRRRLYTRAQVEGIRAIALEEGLIPPTKKPIRETRFTERVLDLFTRLQENL